MTAPNNPHDSADRPKPAVPGRPSGVRRSTLLRAAAGALVGGAALAACGSDDEGREHGGSGDGGRGTTSSDGPAAGLDAKKIANLTGPGITSRFRMQATDLGIPVRTPDGRLLFVFGDSYEKPYVSNKNFWRSPTALYSRTRDLNGGVEWSGAVGGRWARQLVRYPHDNREFSTVLPSDVITIGDTMYLHVMVNKGLMNVIRTEIWRSDDNGATWHKTEAKFKGTEQHGRFQLLTWALGDDDRVYILSTKFNRKESVILSRVRSSRILDPDAYETLGRGKDGWKWGRGLEATPVLHGRFGELCLRRISGKWLLTCFNAGTAAIEGRLLDGAPDAGVGHLPAKKLISGGEWGAQDDSHVAMLYGGYVIPGSSLDELHLSVSQWKNLKRNKGGWPYRVMQYRVRGFA